MLLCELRDGKLVGGVVGLWVRSAGRDKRADVCGDDSAKVGAEAVEVLEVFGEATIGAAEGKEGFPRPFDFGRAATELEGLVLCVVRGHV